LSQNETGKGQKSAKYGFFKILPKLLLFSPHEVNTKNDGLLTRKKGGEKIGNEKIGGTIGREKSVRKIGGDNRWENRWGQSVRSPR